MEFKEEAERKIRGLEENLASQLNQVLCKKTQAVVWVDEETPELVHKHDSCYQLFPRVRLLEDTPSKNHVVWYFSISFPVPLVAW